MKKRPSKKRQYTNWKNRADELENEVGSLNARLEKSIIAENAVRSIAETMLDVMRGDINAMIEERINEIEVSVF